MPSYIESPHVGPLSDRRSNTWHKIAIHRDTPEPAWHRNLRRRRQTARGIVAAQKLGYPISPPVAAAAEARLLAHHSADHTMSLPQWRLAQLGAQAAQEAIAAACGSMSRSGKGGGKGANGKNTWDDWGPRAKAGGKGKNGGKGNWQGQGKGGAGLDCGRCGGQHLSSQCPCRTNDQDCHKCGRTGHTAKMCTSKKPLSEEKCSVCNETGHTKKTCLKTPCSKCGEEGHTVWFCKKRNKGQQTPRRSSANRAGRKTGTSSSGYAVPATLT